MPVAEPCRKQSEPHFFWGEEKRMSQMIEYPLVVIAAFILFTIWGVGVLTVYMKYHSAIGADKFRTPPFAIDKAIFLFLFDGLLMLMAVSVELYRIATRLPTLKDADKLPYMMPHVASDILVGVGVLLGVGTWILYMLQQSSSNEAPKRNA